jgi:hypothetical protein
LIATFQAALVPAQGRRSTITDTFGFKCIEIPTGIILTLVLKKIISEREAGRKGVKEEERTGVETTNRVTHIRSSRIGVQLYTITNVALIDVICRRVQFILVSIHTTAEFEGAAQVCILSVSAGSIGRNRPRSNGGHTVTDSQPDQHDMVCDLCSNESSMAYSRNRATTD